MTSKSLVGSLSQTEWSLLAETSRSALTELDEDKLLALHSRVRRNRTKYVTLYRREASARVADVGGRGAAGPRNARAADKAELFEKALSRVSTALAAAARTSAAALRTERLAAARDKRSGPSAVVDDFATVSPTPKGKGRAASTRTPVARKNVAATTAGGARRQAKRDSR